METERLLKVSFLTTWTFPGPAQGALGLCLQRLCATASPTSSNVRHAGRGGFRNCQVDCAVLSEVCRKGRKGKKKKAQPNASSSTFGRVTTSQGNKAKSGGTRRSWGRAVFMLSLAAIWSQPWCMKNQGCACMSYGFSSSSPFRLRIPLPPVMAKYPACYFGVLCLSALNWNSFPGTKLKTKGEQETGGMLPVHCSDPRLLALCSAPGLLRKRKYSSKRV